MYEGIFKDGLINEGSLSLPDGRKYVGQFEENLMHGAGILTFSNGGQYDGQFNNDLMEGYGILTFTDGG